MIYLIGSLRNPEIPKIAQRLRTEGHEVYDEWHAGGPTQDDCWQEYEHHRRRTFAQALAGWHATNVYENDKRQLDRAEAGVLVLPAGKSGHLELGFLAGQGKRTYVLLDREPERFDVMYKFIEGGVYSTLDELVAALAVDKKVMPRQTSVKDADYKKFLSDPPFGDEDLRYAIGEFEPLQYGVNI